MNKNQTAKSNQKTESQSKQKTNEDFNKQKSNPNDPNQNKNYYADDLDDHENKKRAPTTKNVGMRKDSQNGNKGKVDYKKS
jgi:hypothetical protein